ncbi:uncharacterized protein BP01DRAFT_182604 [Aspergillus saccharolyticus JOP 1030-1]|uniref:Uncharacterized protein n=1 Tax=Aspergillus saccharolyticus JOP 1030-1 TaxID=1450539 RepID=A0A318Z2K2_9EURO|nr:hypothetical protein BP01DRAFT_182604 [Aspergillus saccharolyticus JOP 1030-1]PYH41209.1 hypothetical protein BP01DRAFT_182604 [Aspergillus saccharolyticus JOP 1030-1]
MTLTYKILTVKGPLHNHIAKIATLVADTIAAQEFKDLLDAPRTYRIDMTSALQSNGSLEELNPSPDESCELIPTSIIHITKLWLSPNGGLGCYSFESKSILDSIADLTSTEITMRDDTKGIQVSGTSEGDVDEALAKLTRVERPLTCIQRPIIANILVTAEDECSRYRLQTYNTLNPIAERRVLADPCLDPNAAPGEMYVSVQASLDPDTHTLRMPPNLVNPPHLAYDPGKSRIWNDFTFQQLGSGEQYNAVVSIADSTISKTDAMTMEIPASLHPYLTAEKAKQVNQWVVEGAQVEKDIPERESVVLDTTQPLLAAPTPALQALVSKPSAPGPGNVIDASGPHRPAGVKVRRVVPTSSKPKSQVAPSVSEARPTSGKTPPIAESESPNATTPGLNGNGLAPRRRWVMQYDIKYGNQDLQDVKPAEKAGTESRPRSQVLSSVNKSTAPSTSKSTRYDLTRSHTQRSFGKRSTPNIGPAANWKPGRQNQLIDINVPVTAAASVQGITFNQPALLPSGSSPCGTDTTGSVERASIDLLGLNLGTENFLDSSNSGSCLEAAPSRINNAMSQVGRLEFLRQRYNAAATEVLPTTNEATTAPAPRSQANESWAQAMVANLRRADRSERESSDEVTSREFRKTRHKAPKSSSAARSKAETKARRQATLEDSWGIGKPKKKPVCSPKSQKSTTSSIVQVTNGPKPSSVEDPAAQRQVKRLYDSMIPILDSAACYPGAMCLEMQFGLILVPLLPKTYNEDSMIAETWNKVFSPQSGLSAPTTKFIKRLTTSGADIDHMVDIRTSKADGKHRLFEQEYTDYGVSYEYHFRTRANQIFIVVINENGGCSVREPGKALGAVNFHFPGNTWDANLSVKKVTGFVGDINPEFEQIAQDLVKSMWIEPDRTLIRIYTRLPSDVDNKVTLENVYMKRWTRHRHLQCDEEASATSDTRPSQKPSEDDINATSHIFLQVTEVQDLIHGKHVTDPTIRRARATAPADMVSNGQLWYEASLVSPAIDALLNSNTDLEVGERSSDWRGIDLFGRHAAALLREINVSADADADAIGTEMETPSPVAKAIGHAGLGDIFLLAKTVIQRIDAVGYWNARPGIDLAAEHTTTATSLRSCAQPRGVVGLSLGNDSHSDDTISARVDSRGVVQYPAQVDVFSPEEFW